MITPVQYTFNHFRFWNLAATDYQKVAVCIVIIVFAYLSNRVFLIQLKF